MSLRERIRERDINWWAWAWKAIRIAVSAVAGLVVLWATFYLQILVLNPRTAEAVIALWVAVETSDAVIAMLEVE